MGGEWERREVGWGGEGEGRVEVEGRVGSPGERGRNRGVRKEGLGSERSCGKRRRTVVRSGWVGRGGGRARGLEGMRGLGPERGKRRGGGKERLVYGNGEELTERKRGGLEEGKRRYGGGKC